MNKCVNKHTDKHADKCDLALVIADLGSGGAQKVAMALVRDLTDAGKRVAVITFSDDAADFHALPDSVQRIMLDRYNARKGLLANVVRVLGLRRALKGLAPRTVLGFIAPTNVIVSLAGLGLKTRVVISERNDPKLQSFGRPWDFLRVATYRFCDIITANSENAIESMRSYVPAAKLKFVPNGLAKSSVVSSHDDKVILNVGRLHPQKNHKVLIDAFKDVHQLYPEWRLVIAGEGPLRGALEEQVDAHGLKGAVVFKGVVSDPYTLYERAPIFALPSLHEGTPNALLEAMSCGLAPVVSDACTGAIPYVREGESGKIVAVNDAPALSKALIDLIADAEQSKIIGAGARKAVEPLYAKNTDELWLDVLF